MTMKVKVHAIKERKLPELNDELAKTLGLESVDKLKETIANSYIQSRTNLSKSMAQKNLLDALLKMVQFELPQPCGNPDEHTAGRHGRRAGTSGT